MGGGGSLPSALSPILTHSAGLHTDSSYERTSLHCVISATNTTRPNTYHLYVSVTTTEIGGENEGAARNSCLNRTHVCAFAVEMDVYSVKSDSGKNV